MVFQEIWVEMQNRGKLLEDWPGYWIKLIEDIKVICTFYFS